MCKSKRKDAHQYFTIISLEFQDTARNFSVFAKFNQAILAILTMKRGSFMKQIHERPFTTKGLLRLLIPLIIEQLLAVTVGLADSMMVASLGEAAVSSVSLV